MGLSKEADGSLHLSVTVVGLAGAFSGSGRVPLGSAGVVVRVEWDRGEIDVYLNEKRMDPD